MKPIKLANTTTMTHDEWLAQRQKGIGGSDVAAICGVSRYRSTLNVYLDKIGEIPPLTDNQRMRAGRMLEPVIADMFAEDTGKKVKRNNMLLQHPEHKFMLANIDRWIVGENAGLEIKNTSEYAKGDWANGAVPVEYMLQCNHYLAVTGADRWYIAVLIGGHDLQWRIIERDETLIANLISIEKQFWEEHVLARVEPVVTHLDTDWLKRMYPQSEPLKEIELDDSLYDTLVDLNQAELEGKLIDQRIETAKNRLKQAMQDAEIALYSGKKICTWKTNKKGVRTFKSIGGEE
jgi:putative phage-type endonuclease